MIVIRSKPLKGKMNFLVNEIEALLKENKILVIDSLYTYDFFKHLENIDYVSLYNFPIAKNFIKAGLGYYNYFILNFNVNEINIGYYKSMEEELRREFKNVEFILTVQEHANSENEKVLMQTI